MFWENGFQIPRACDSRDFSLSSVHRPRQPRHQSIRSQSRFQHMLLPQRSGPCWRFTRARAERKPDVAGVRYQSLEVLERSSVDNLMKDGPVGACFWWTELLLFFEFKLVYKQLIVGLVRDAVTRNRSSSTSYCVF